MPRTLRWILLLALVQGVLYALIIPPWWHNDEMGHFEYAWLAANLPAWPKAGQYDPAMRLQMAISASNVRWYQVRGLKPDLTDSASLPIGVTQTGREPLYYFLASLPLRLVHNTDITFQYYVARSVSFILYLLILVVIWFTLGEFLPPDHPLRWMVLTFLALLPGFIDAMTAVNNDVIAVLTTCLFLWVSLRLIMRGFSLRRLLFLGLSLILCYIGKHTTQFTFLLTPLVLLLALLRGRWTWVVIGVCALAAVIAPLAALEWGSPLGWYQTPAQALPLRSPSAHSPLGSYVFQISYHKPDTSAQLMQFVSPYVIKSISNQTITLGGWFWSDSAAQSISPYILFGTNIKRNVNGNLFSTIIRSPQTPLVLDTHPTFYRFVIQAPSYTEFATIYIPLTLSSPDSRIFMDGLVLAPGEFSEAPPHFTDPNGTQGIWDGRQFLNVIRDGSAEQDSLRFRPWIQEMLVKLPVNGLSVIDPSFIVSTLLDRHGVGWYYRETSSSLFRTFWTSLAADRTDRPPAPSSSTYWLMLLTFLGVVGSLFWLWRKRKSLRWDVLFLLGLTLLISGVVVIVRGMSGFEVADPVIGGARYADPAILPMALILCAGWLEWLNLLKDRIKFTDRTLTAIFTGGLLGISLMAMANAIQTIDSDWWQDWRSLIYLLLFQIVSIQTILLSRKTQPNS